LAKFSFSETPAGTGSIISFIVANLNTLNHANHRTLGPSECIYRREILTTVTQETAPDNASFVLHAIHRQILHIP
jgi:hypothetical protein